MSGVLDVVMYPDARLRVVSLPVLETDFDADLADLVESLILTMRAHDGVAIAAPQVGRHTRVIVVEAEVAGLPADYEPLVFVNPIVIDVRLRPVESEEEGCLSFPEIRVAIERPTLLTVQARNFRTGAPFETQAEGIFARAILHEVEHLDAILLIDHASTLKKKIITRRMKRQKSDAETARLHGQRGERLRTTPGRCHSCAHFSSLADSPKKIPQKWKLGTCGGGGVDAAGKPVDIVLRTYGCEKFAALGM